ncbi:MAG: DUF6527 family protein [Terriglobales bacterium]|jgi:hypothetical protein
MKRDLVLKHEFVEFIPDKLEGGIVYVSIPYATVAHKCCCGCGTEVVTPLSPTDWKLIFDGETISLDPSIGSWSFNCKSHYWIRRNKVKWAARWSHDEIDAVRLHERLAKANYYGTGEKKADAAVDETPADQSGQEGADKPKRRFWRRLRKWWS